MRAVTLLDVLKIEEGLFRIRFDRHPEADNGRLILTPLTVEGQTLAKFLFPEGHGHFIRVALDWIPELEEHRGSRA